MAEPFSSGTDSSNREDITEKGQGPDPGLFVFLKIQVGEWR